MVTTLDWHAPMPSTPTLRTLADAAGVSVMAVSLALRGRRGVSEETRRKVQTLAAEMGYHPDPVASELMAQLRSHRRSGIGSCVAFLNTFHDPAIYHTFPGLVQFIEGAKAAGQDYGYAVEEFALYQRRMTSSRISKILKTRGVRGIIVGPRWIDEEIDDFPWNEYASVVVGEAVFQPNLHRVCNDHAHTMATALRALAGKGYRRIMVGISDPFESARDSAFSRGIDVFRRGSPDACELVEWHYKHWDEERFASDLVRIRPDAVVTHGDQAGFWMEKNISWEDYGYANLSVESGSRWSGVNQHSFDIGMAAMDQLRLLLLRGVRGLQPRTSISLLQGEWQEGSSTPGPRSSGRLRRS